MSQKVYETSKENIYLLRFPKEDVIQDKVNRKLRSFQLKRAMRLGNLLKNKVSIYFKDSIERIIKVETTVWGVTKDSVILKKGVVLPIHRITRID